MQVSARGGTPKPNFFCQGPKQRGRRCHINSRLALPSITRADSSVLLRAAKIVKQLPVERDNRIAYRIKSPAEAFERIAEESQLRRSADLP